MANRLAKVISNLPSKGPAEWGDELHSWSEQQQM
jgi:hypothetical protein